MKFLATPWALAVATVLAAGSARAYEPGIAINWNGCLGDGVQQGMTFACDTNAGPSFVLYASLVVPADMPMFAATTATFDVYPQGSVTPPWWQLAPGECRAAALNVSFDPATFVTGCPNVWQDQQNLSVLHVTHVSNAWVRIQSGAAVGPGFEIPLVADGTELVVAKLVLTRTRTTGPNGCSGCQTCAEIDLYECFVQQPLPWPSYHVTHHFMPYPFQAKWNGFCDHTPTQNRSWGQIKSLYR